MKKQPGHPRLYQDSDLNRHPTAANYAGPVDGAPPRSPFRADLVSLVHCPFFRRLEGKTQLFPASESDLFRNRLTHSIEVAQVAKDITAKLNLDPPFYGLSGNRNNGIDSDLVEFAALAHDIGHPPFGHTGEKSLDSEMLKYGGFEGNAQSLRIVTRLARRQYPEEAVEEANPESALVSTQGKDKRVGLNLTYRTIASILKYPATIPDLRKPGDSVVKGHYYQEKELVQRVRDAVTQGCSIPNDQPFRVLECWIMDVADDIAYSTYDIEDALCAGVLTAADFLHPKHEVLESVVVHLKKRHGACSAEEVKTTLREFAERVRFFVVQRGGVIHSPKSAGKRRPNEDELYRASERIMLDSHIRTQLMAWWIDYLVSQVRVTINESCLALSQVHLADPVRKQVEILKSFVFQSVTSSTPLQSLNFRGDRIVREVFHAFEKYEEKLLPPYERRLIARLIPNGIGEDIGQQRLRKRLLCDYVSGMTDAFAAHLYDQLMSGSVDKIVNHQIYY